ncbi:MAG TPA: hypothetical protein VHC69_06740 [Polyangiaceae bacterium]|nr:hypothetical protein [Polyangiaceae bacterium]
MREASPGWGWVWPVLIGCFVACSSNDVVLETRRGDPAPSDDDAGAPSTTEDAGPPKGVDPDSLRSGSRIHVRVQVSDGELLQVVGLHDTLYDVDCHIDVADDGVSRCLPAAYAGVVYADADCTEPLMRFGPSEPPCDGPPLPMYALLDDSVTNLCSKSTFHVVISGARIDSPPQLYDNANRDGTCQPTSAGTSTIYATNPSPASDWVAFQSTVTPLTSRLGVIQWSGSDGSRMPGDTVLLSNDEPCDPDKLPSVPPNPDTVSHCIPRNVQNITNGPYFSDAACTAAIAVAPACDPPELITEFTPSSDSCDDSAAGYFALGDVVSSMVYTTTPSLQSGSCSPAGSQSAGQMAYTKGAPVDPAMYPPMQMVLVGSGRVRHYEWQSEGVSISNSGSLVDAATKAPVTPTVFVDGVTRGVFSATTTDKFFSDANCKTWMLDEPTLLDTCAAPELPRWVSFEATPTAAMPICEGYFTQSAVRPVLGKHTGKVYTLDLDINAEMNGACSEYVPSKSTVTYDFYDLGNPIPASSLFAEIETVDL